jgi:CBS domain containing-hemolysin-like protein
MIHYFNLVTTSRRRLERRTKEDRVGEIMDETDVESLHLKKADKFTLIVSGDEIDDINEALNVNLPRGDGYSTISGLLHDTLKRIPRNKDQMVINDVHITVEETGRTAPIKIIVEKSRSQLENESSPSNAE